VKITVIPKSSEKVTTISVCPWLVDQPPVAKKD
jgi:hypothetical protein